MTQQRAGEELTRLAEQRMQGTDGDAWAAALQSAMAERPDLEAAYYGRGPDPKQLAGEELDRLAQYRMAAAGATGSDAYFHALQAVMGERPDLSRAYFGYNVAPARAA